MVVVVYTSSASGNPAVRNKQKAIIDYLVLHKIEFEEIDLCVHTDAKDLMRSKIPEDIKKKNEASGKTVIPPQVFNDDVYCGDYEMFFNANEMQLVHTFFKVCPTPQKAQRVPVSGSSHYLRVTSHFESLHILTRVKSSQSIFKGDSIFGGDSSQVKSRVKSHFKSSCPFEEEKRLAEFQKQNIPIKF